MQKNKSVKIVVLIIAFLVTVFVSLTYISTEKFNVISFSKTAVTVFSQSDAKDYNDEYITSKQVISVGEPDGVGAVLYGYSLSLEEAPEKIISVSIGFDSDRTSVGNITLNVTNENGERAFDVSNTSIKNCSVLMQVGVGSVDDIKIISTYDAFGGATITDEKIANISNVKINDPDDILTLKKQFWFNVVKSLMVSGIVWAVAFLIVKSKADKKIFNNRFSIEKVFLIAAIFIGLIFSFLFPVYQVPDEQTHINMVYYELNWDVDIKMQGEICDFADTLRIIRNYDQKVDLSTYFNSNIKAPLPSSFSLPSLQIIRHLPQAIGFVLTTLLRLPLWLCVAFGEICALVVYAIFGYLTIKIIPFKKELMSAILLLPICLQEFPSFSYDSFLLAAYLLLFAYILHVKFTKEKFTLLDVLVILSLTIVVVVTKIPYALVVGLVLTIPISKIDFNFGVFKLTGDFIKKHKIVFGICAVLCVSIVVVLGIKVIPHVPEGKTFLAAVYDIKASARLILTTIKLYFGDWLIKITGNLGWFDTPVALIFTVFVIANLFFLNLFDYNNALKKPADKNPFKIMDITIAVAIAGVMGIVTILSMFGWTMSAYGIDANAISVAQTAEYMNQIPQIGGLQGRYFVPIIPLLLVPCYFPKISGALQKINHTTYLCGYHIIVFIYIASVVLNRYWI